VDERRMTRPDPQEREKEEYPYPLSGRPLLVKGIKSVCQATLKERKRKEKFSKTKIN